MKPLHHPPDHRPDRLPILFADDATTELRRSFRRYLRAGCPDDMLMDWTWASIYRAQLDRMERTRRENLVQYRNARSPGQGSARNKIHMNDVSLHNANGSDGEFTDAGEVPPKSRKTDERNGDSGDAT